jgi:hypothetical protein
MKAGRRHVHIMNHSAARRVDVTAFDPAQSSRGRVNDAGDGL